MNAVKRPWPGLYIEQLGPTPLVPVRLSEAAPTIWCKLEYLNPSGSTKDRMATYILRRAWEAGRLCPGQAVIEASSGSSSIALAMACAQVGLKFTAVLAPGVSSERVMMIRAYGGEVVYCAAGLGIAGAIERSQQLGMECNAFLPRQFENDDNVEAHRQGTAREIALQMPAHLRQRVGAVVSGVGTGGTLVGIYRGLKDVECPVRPVAARPVVQGDQPARVAGTGCFNEAECCSFSGRIPGVVDKLSKLYRPRELEGLIEVDVDDERAIQASRALIRKGFPVGPSSGLNFAAAVQVASQLPPDTVIVTVLPDRMERYFSTDLFSHVREP